MAVCVCLLLDCVRRVVKEEGYWALGETVVRAVERFRRKVVVGFRRKGAVGFGR